MDHEPEPRPTSVRARRARRSRWPVALVTATAVLLGVGSLCVVAAATPLASVDATADAPPSSVVQRAVLPGAPDPGARMPVDPAPTDPSPIDADPPGPAVRPRVAVVGDSLVAQSSEDQVRVLERAGFDPTVFGDPGKALGAPSVQAAIGAALADPEVGIVVLATASNDNVAYATRADEIGDDAARAEHRGHLTAQLAATGDRCVVLVDGRDVSAPLYRPERAPVTNAVLRDVAAARPGTVVVAWSDISRPHGDDWFVADQLHFSDGLAGRPATVSRPDGADAYARAIADGVGRCRV